MSPFDFVNSINTTKENLIVDDISEKSYNSFMVNRSLSYFIDTVFFSQEMNANHNLDNKMQYDFLRLSIKKGKRFSKWAKADKSIELDAVKFVYKVSNQVAESYIKCMKPDDLKKIVEMYSTTIKIKK